MSGNAGTLKPGLTWGCVRIVEALKRDWCGNRRWKLHCSKCGRDFTRGESALLGWSPTPRAHCPLCKPPRSHKTAKQEADRKRLHPTDKIHRTCSVRSETLRDPILRCPKCADQPWRRPHRLGIATEPCVCHRMYQAERIERGPSIRSHAHGMAMGVGGRA